MSYTARIEGLEKLKFDKADEITRAEVQQAMHKATKTVVANVRPLVPVFQGRLRNSIEDRVDTLPTTIIGRIGSSLKSETYPAVMELGRKPGTFPPVSALERWAHLVLGNARLAFTVARAIYRRGIKGHFYLKRGLESSLGAINGYFNDALTKIGKGLVGK